MAFARGLARALSVLALSVASAAAPASDPSPVRLASETATFEAPTEPPDPDAAPPVLVEPEGALSLPDALALALMHSPLLQSFSWEVRASEARRIEAHAFANPEIELRFYKLDAPEPDDEDSRRRVIVSQELELGGQRGRRTDLARAETTVAQQDYEAVRLEVATQVASDLAEVLGDQRRVAAWTEMVRFVQEMHDAADELVESGSVRRVEAHEAARELGRARIELQQAEADLASARFTLAANWGSVAPRFTEAVGNLEDLPPLPDFATLLSRLAAAPGTARADAEVEAGRASLALAKSERVPNLTIGAGVRWDDHLDQGDYLFDLEIALPIFDRKKGVVREARYELARAESESRAAAASSALTVAELYHALAESDGRRAALEREIVPASRAVFEAYRTGFADESESLENLLDSRRDLANAEADLADALADCHQARAALEYVLGGSLN